MAKKTSAKRTYDKAHHPALVVTILGSGIAGVLLMFGLIWGT